MEEIQYIKTVRKSNASEPSVNKITKSLEIATKTDRRQVTSTTTALNKTTESRVLEVKDSVTAQKNDAHKKIDLKREAKSNDIEDKVSSATVIAHANSSDDKTFKKPTPVRQWRRTAMATRYSSRKPEPKQFKKPISTPLGKKPSSARNAVKKTNSKKVERLKSASDETEDISSEEEDFGSDADLGKNTPPSGNRQLKKGTGSPTKRSVASAGLKDKKSLKATETQPEDILSEEEDFGSETELEDIRPASGGVIVKPGAPKRSSGTAALGLNVKKTTESEKIEPEDILSDEDFDNETEVSGTNVKCSSPIKKQKYIESENAEPEEILSEEDFDNESEVIAQASTSQEIESDKNLNTTEPGRKGAKEKSEKIKRTRAWYIFRLPGNKMSKTGRLKKTRVITSRHMLRRKRLQKRKCNSRVALNVNSEKSDEAEEATSDVSETGEAGDVQSVSEIYEALEVLDEAELEDDSPVAEPVDANSDEREETSSVVSTGEVPDVQAKSNEATINLDAEEELEDDSAVPEPVVTDSDEPEEATSVVSTDEVLDVQAEHNTSTKNLDAKVELEDDSAVPVPVGTDSDEPEEATSVISTDEVLDLPAEHNTSTKNVDSKVELEDDSAVPEPEEVTSIVSTEEVLDVQAEHNTSTKNLDSKVELEDDSAVPEPVGTDSDEPEEDTSVVSNTSTKNLDSKVELEDDSAVPEPVGTNLDKPEEATSVISTEVVPDVQAESNEVTKNVNAKVVVAEPVDADKVKLEVVQFAVAVTCKLEENEDLKADAESELKQKSCSRTRRSPRVQKGMQNVRVSLNVENDNASSGTCDPGNSDSKSAESSVSTTKASEVKSENSTATEISDITAELDSAVAKRFDAGNVDKNIPGAMPSKDEDSNVKAEPKSETGVEHSNVKVESKAETGDKHSNVNVEPKAETGDEHSNVKAEPKGETGVMQSLEMMTCEFDANQDSEVDAESESKEKSGPRTRRSPRVQKRKLNGKGALDVKNDDASDSDSKRVESVVTTGEASVVENLELGISDSTTLKGEQNVCPMVEPTVGPSTEATTCDLEDKQNANVESDPIVPQKEEQVVVDEVEHFDQTSTAKTRKNSPGKRQMARRSRGRSRQRSGGRQKVKSPVRVLEQHRGRSTHHTRRRKM